MINIDTRIFAKVSESEYWLLSHIAKRLNDKAACFPSNETLLKDTGWGIDKLQANKRSLIKKKILAVENRFKESRQTSNHYVIKTDLIGVFVSIKELTKEGLIQGEGAENQPPSNTGKTNTREGGGNQVTEVLSREEVLIPDTRVSGTQTEAFVEDSPQMAEQAEEIAEQLIDSKKYASEIYKSFVEKWTQQYRELGFDAVSGKKIKMMIEKTRKDIVDRNEAPTRQRMVGMFEYVLAYVKREGHFVHGKPITTFDQQYLSVIFEIRNGKPQQKKKSSTSVFSKYHGV